MEDWLIEREEEAATLFGSLASEMTGAVVDRYVNSLTAAADLSTLDGLSVIWRQFLAGPGSEYVAAMHLSGHLSAFLGAADAMPYVDQQKWADVANRNAIEYQKAALNRMADDTLWPDVRARVTEKLTVGMTIPELTREMEAVTGYARGRAEAIARTESLTAYNRGDIAGARALGKFGPVEKQWVAARDARTRPSHVEASGQVVALDQPFTVGGVEMDSPGAPGAPAGEVVNCRCIMIFLWPGDTRPDGTEVPEAGTVFDTAPAPEPAVRRRDSLDNWRPEIAEQYDVTSQDLVGNWEETHRLRRQVRDEAALAQYESLGWLERAGAMQMRRPGRTPGAEYDWYRGLSRREKARLSRWFNDDAKAAIDVVHHAAQGSGAISKASSIDDFAEQWLHHTRIVDMGASVRSGRWPVNNARFGNLDPDVLAPRTRLGGFDPGKIIGVDFDNANGHIASIYKREAADQAYSILGPSTSSSAPPWRMSFQSWEEEVRGLEEVAREARAAGRAVSSVQADRYRELVPPGIDSGQDFEVLYAEVVETARIAELDVADWATIPWGAA